MNAATAPSKLLVALVAVGGVLLLAIIAIVFLLIGRGAVGGPIGAGAPSPAPVVTQTPVDAPATPTAEPIEQAVDQPVQQPAQPADTSPRFTAFSATVNVQCDPTGEEPKPMPQLSYTAVNAAKIYWTPNAQEANAGNGYPLPASGNGQTLAASKGAGGEYLFPCNHRQTFDTTITLVGADGQKVSETVTFIDVNWGTGGDDED